MLAYLVKTNVGCYRLFPFFLLFKNKRMLTNASERVWESSGNILFVSGSNRVYEKRGLHLERQSAAHKGVLLITEKYPKQLPRYTQNYLKVPNYPIVPKSTVSGLWGMFGQVFEHFWVLYFLVHFCFIGQWSETGKTGQREGMT